MVHWYPNTCYNGIKVKKLQFKNDTKIFSALNRQKHKNIRPAPKKQLSYKKERVYIKKIDC